MNILKYITTENEDPSDATLTSPPLDTYENIPTSYIFDNKTMNYKLADFYIAGSYNSYSPMGGTMSYNSLNQIRNVLVQGARFLKLDIYDNDFSLELGSETIGYGNSPYVRGEKQYKLKDSINKALNLDDCFSIIKEYSWSVEHNLSFDIIFRFTLQSL